LLFNPMAERMFGASALTSVSTDWPERFGFYLSDRTTPFPQNELPLIKAIRGEEVDNVEMFVRNKNLPQGRWMRITGRPLLGSTGELLGGVIVGRDIT